MTKEERALLHYNSAILRGLILCAANFRMISEKSGEEHYNKLGDLMVDAGFEDVTP